MIEVELKFQVPTEASSLLQARLDALPSSERLGQREIADIYYDTVAFDCLRQAVFIRTRNRERLEIKYHEQDDPAHLHCNELAVELSADPLQVQALNDLCAGFLPGWREASNVEDALHANGLEAFIHLQNQRTHYVYEDLTLCVDRVEGLGDFFEVEKSCQEESEVEEAEASLHHFVSSLSLPEIQPVQVGYVELWLRQYLPQVYALGIYQEK